MRKKHSFYPIQLEPTGSIIPKQNKRLKLSDEIRQKQLMEEWFEVAGPRTSEHARPIRFQHGVLVIRVSNPHWMQELGYYKGRYVQLLNEQLGAHVIRELRLELGELPPLPEPLQTNKEDDVPEWLHLQVPPEIEAEIEQKLAHLPENEIKQSARRIMLNHHKLTHMRQRHKRPRR